MQYRYTDCDPLNHSDVYLQSLIKLSNVIYQTTQSTYRYIIVYFSLFNRKKPVGINNYKKIKNFLDKTVYLFDI